MKQRPKKATKPRQAPPRDPDFGRRDDYMDQSREARGHHRSPAGASTI